jgi:hypothetical protein
VVTVVLQIYCLGQLYSDSNQGTIIQLLSGFSGKG